MDVLSVNKVSTFYILGRNLYSLNFDRNFVTIKQNCPVIKLASYRANSVKYKTTGPYILGVGGADKVGDTASRCHYVQLFL